MARYDICRYGEQSDFGAATGVLVNNGTLTGHHIIPDHCFYYTAGLRGRGDLSGFLIPGIRRYTTANAPVIIVDADYNGGKSRTHGLIHAVFDPIELTAARSNGNQWTYAAAREAAIQSIVTNVSRWSAAEVEAVLDEYFVDVCGVMEESLLRAGEHGTMRDAPAPRKSGRLGRTNIKGRRASPY